MSNPWRKRPQPIIGGLTHIGFFEDSELLLAVSHDGRGLFDAASGERIARDAASDFSFDVGRLVVEGIGPLAGQEVRVAGLFGGGLPLTTHDHWTVEARPQARPKVDIYLCPMVGRPEEAVRVAALDVAQLAFGFSSTGNSLAVASSHDLILWGR